VSGGIDFPGYAARPVVQRLAVRRFDASRDEWIEARGEGRAEDRSSIACATFNTWFQGPEPALRHAGLLAELRRADADVIALQEVNTALLDRIRAEAWVREGYVLARTPFRVDTVPTHGLALLSRLPLGGVRLHPLPTHMGRGVLVAEVRIEGAPLALAVVHLESMKPNADVRGAQLAAVFALLEGHADAIIAGDFNFCASWPEENGRIDARYADLWARLRPGEAGYTQDTEANAMLAKARAGERKQVRIDRILLRGDAGR